MRIYLFAMSYKNRFGLKKFKWCSLELERTRVGRGISFNAVISAERGYGSSCEVLIVAITGHALFLYFSPINKVTS